MEQQRNNITVFGMRVGNGTNFKKGAHLTRGKLLKLKKCKRITNNHTGVGYWAIAANDKRVSRVFQNEAKPGDLLWFIQTGGKVIGIAEFVCMHDERRFSNDDMAWDDDSGGPCEREVIYSNLITTELCDYSLRIIQRKSVFKIEPPVSNGDNLIDIYRHLRQFRRATHHQS